MVRAVVAAALSAGTLDVHAQTAASPAPVAFEVASVKANRDGPTGSSITRRGGSLNAVNVPLRALITLAYRLQGFQLVNAPDWIANERFDIVAKVDGNQPPAPPDSGPPDLNALRTLLADRFKLVAHRETRELDIYALVRTKPDGALGPALQQASGECARIGKAVASGAPIPTGPSAPYCGFNFGAGRIRFGATPVSALASGLAVRVGRYVVDRTGLTGPWDFELTFAAEPPPGLLPPGIEAQPVDSNAPSLFTAIQEQLGLKLEAARGPVDVLVIDSVDRPIAD